jgi:hypothetical protein
MEQHTILARRQPPAADISCLVCLGLVPAGTAAEVVTIRVDAVPLLGQSAYRDYCAIVAHEPCIETVRTGTTSDVLALRATPKGPRVDQEGAVVLLHEGVRFRVTGSHRTAVMAGIHEAIRAYGTRATYMPIVAFVRDFVTSRPPLQAVVGSIVESPGLPPNVRGPADPAHVVTFTTRSVHPATPEDTARYGTAHTSAAPGYTTAPPPSGSYNPLDDPNRPVKPGYHRSQKGMSPNGGDNQTRSSPAQGSPGAPASGRPLPPPGEVTSAMLDPLDTEESLRLRPTVAGHIQTGLAKAYPRLRIKSVTLDRDPVSLAERVHVILDRRVVSETCEHLAADMSATLRGRVPSWSTMEASGVKLVVEDDPASVASGGDNELHDEVNLRSLPPWPKAYNAPKVVGAKVAMRGPLWSALLGTAASEETDVLLGPYAPEVRRIRAKLLKLLDADPATGGHRDATGAAVQEARIGVMEGYDAATDHACVVVTPPGGQPFFIHCHPSWLMVWNMPPAPAAPTLAPAPVSATKSATDALAELFKRGV